MATRRMRLFVSPSAGSWVLQSEAGNGESSHLTREAAIAAARAIVAGLPEGTCSQITITVQGTDGQFRTGWTYGRDAYPPGGKPVLACPPAQDERAWGSSQTSG